MAEDMVTAIAQKAGAAVAAVTAKMVTDSKEQVAAQDKVEQSAKTVGRAHESLAATVAKGAASVAGGMLAFSGLTNVMDSVSGAIKGTISAGIEYQDSLNTLRSVSGA